MNKNDLIYKRTARRIIESPRSLEQMLSVLDNTPPVVPETEEEAYERGYTAGQMAQRKPGKWMRHFVRPGVYADLYWHCSECDFKCADNWTYKWKYCPGCGAKMEGAEPEGE